MASISELFQNHYLYPEFLQVQNRLAEHQFVCWLAGGAVRDFLLGIDCDDFDLVTDASTENLKQIFPEALLVGEKFGVLKIILKNGKYFDLTTFRQESDYVDGRRPSAVSASTPLQDALRRDFTINAMFWDQKNLRLVDYVGGQKDLERKTIVAVGNPAVRFQEDYLRILRLLRFSAQFQFEIETETLQAGSQNTMGLNRISGERIWTELKKIQTEISWNYVMCQPLFFKILNSVFNVEITLESEGLKFFKASDSSFHLFFLLSKLKSEEANLNKMFFDRLRLSKNEIKIFEIFIFVRQKMSEISLYDLCIEIENKNILKDVLEYFVEQHVIEQVFVEKALKILSTYPEHLIKGQGLVGVVKPHQIRLVLLAVRRLQFEGILKNELDAFEFIKKEYSSSLE